jgi:hypothetical protein
VAFIIPTDSTGHFSASILPGTYTFAEVLTITPTWFQTGPLPPSQANVVSGTPVVTLNANETYTVTVNSNDSVSNLTFANVCIGKSQGKGGKPPCFYASCKHKHLISSCDLTLLSNLNLKNPDCSDFNPTTVAQFEQWLNMGTSSNMSYLLSVQLATMELNVVNNFVNPNQLIYAPGTNSANANGFATLSAILAEANIALGVDGCATPSDPNYAYQTALKNALENANFNYNFVQCHPSTCPTPVFPQQ